MQKRDFIRSALAGAGALFLAGRSKFTFGKIPKIMEAHHNGSPQKKYFKEAYHYSKGSGGVDCELCPNACFLRPGKKGACRARINQDGKLYTMAYGNPCAVHVDPIEKKPLLHYLPGTHAYSIATAGCVLSCLNCQNWDISQSGPDLTENYDLMPEKVVQECLKNSCESIAYTYSEPTAYYEYMFDTAKIAHARGLKNLMISCGYINDKPLRQLVPFIDAANINLKSFSDEIYQKLNGGALEPILNTLKVMRENHVWLEITNLIVPSWTDDFDMIRRMSEWLVKNGFQDCPLHFNRFFPMHKLTQLPATPAETLMKAREIALKQGMHYVYVGNLPGNEYEDTWCPGCKKKVVNRKGFRLTEMAIEKGKCRYCGTTIAGVWT